MSLLCSAVYAKCPYYVVLYMQSVLILENSGPLHAHRAVQVVASARYSAWAGGCLKMADLALAHVKVSDDTPLHANKDRHHNHDNLG